MSARRSRRGRARSDRAQEQDLEARVLAALAASARGPLKSKELARELGIAQTEYRRFRRFLTGLEGAGKIERVRGHRFTTAGGDAVVQGALTITRRGDGFVRQEPPELDVFVPMGRIGHAMDGDRVAVRIDRRPRGRSPEGTITRVVERARETLVGTYQARRRLSYVTPLDPRLGHPVRVTHVGPSSPDDGDVVVIRMESYGDGKKGMAGAIERVLGPPDAPGVDVLSVAFGHGIVLDFERGVLEAADRAVERGLADPGPDRVDRTAMLVFTIDPADAKDHDDALSIEVREDGKAEVGIHIADVSHFVRPRDLVDREAVSRGTSVYLVDRTIPMLPPALSADACSLRAGEDRLALSLFVILDREGRVHERRYERTSICCREGLSYEEAQAVLDGTASVGEEVDAALRALDDFARAIRATREERGALDIDVPEAKVVLDADGAPIDIRKRDRLSSHRLIEDYMVLANEVVARDLEARALPGLYRVHEPPSEEKVELLRETLSRFGLQVPKRKSLKPRDVQGLLRAVEGRSEAPLVSSLVLRSMKKARYHTENMGHFGLASSGYAHFTSPIRRYPDLVVHRVITEVFVHRGEPPYEEDDLISVADVSSKRERAAEEAERASVMLKKVEFMEGHLGSEFEGAISGITPFGLFVTLDDFFVEGLVHVSGLRDDFYRFEAREYALVGERGGRGFRLEDRVRVQVARVDKEVRQIDFELVRKAPKRMN